MGKEKRPSLQPSNWQCLPGKLIDEGHVYPGSVVTGPAAAGFSDMTNGASAVIPEVLAGQILSLARRGRGRTRHTILTTTTDDSLARDRLVVLLQPDLVSENDGEMSGGLGGDRDSPVGDEERAAGRVVRQQKDKSGSLVAVGADERPRHALVIPCIPGQVRECLAKP